MRTKTVLPAVAVLAFGAVCAAVVKSQPTETSGSDAGLRGEYFNNLWCVGAPVVTRTDPQIDFDWGDGPPAPGIPADFFSVRWTGDLKAPVTDTYTFTVQPEAYIILRIADRTLIGERWGPARGGEGQIALVGGRVYPIELIYEAGRGETGVQLLWETSTRPQEIVPAQVFQLPLRARAPSPGDEAIDVVQNVMLTWTAGCRATLDDVYFGTDANAVADATPATVGIYRGRWSGMLTEFDPGPLDWDRTWYWRVDEVNEAEPGSPWKGSVWSFRTADFLLIDDFESYTDDEYGKRMYEVWVDGWYDNSSGSLVGYLDTGWHPDVVHSGRQAMPLEYNNVGVPYYSRVTRTWDVPQDWTVNHVADLSLWVHGWPVAFLEKPDGQITLSGTGWDTDKGEGFRYAYEEFRGDGEIIARVDSLRSSSGWAGVMVRETAERWHEPPAVKYAAVVVTPGEGVCFMYRRAVNEQKERHRVAGVQAPCWVKLMRRGDTFAAQFSTDGTAWQDVTDSNGVARAVSIPMPEPAYIGLCVTNGAWDNSTAIAEFSQVSLAGSSSELWQTAAINTSDLSNAPAALHVVLEDTTGWRAVAVNREAVNVNEWTRWRIPLSEFGSWGVNLKAIKMMYIDIGDQSYPQPDGRGRIFIDDIRLLCRAQAAVSYPTDGDVNVAQSPVLRWSPCGRATHHDIYFGTDPNLVANAIPATAGVYQGRLARGETSFELPPLDWNKSYWWRVDEVNEAESESPWKGPVWHFTTAAFLVVDDFESYNYDEGKGTRVYETWIDEYWGDFWAITTNLEFVVIHGGRQSLAQDYNNVWMPWYSELEREFSPIQDWTARGMNTLVLHIRGKATNNPQPFYVVVGDATGKKATVVHPDPQVLLAPQWVEWKIPLSELPGVNLRKVKRIYIGAGDKPNPHPGGVGRFYVDDIRVIKSTP